MSSNLSVSSIPCLRGKAYGFSQTVYVQSGYLLEPAWYSDPFFAALMRHPGRRRSSERLKPLRPRDGRPESRGLRIPGCAGGSCFSGMFPGFRQRRQGKRESRHGKTGTAVFHAGISEAKAAGSPVQRGGSAARSFAKREGEQPNRFLNTREKYKGSS